MRSRSRSENEQQQPQQRERAQPERQERPHDHERTGKSQTARVRVPKIQYRFLKELEEQGVSGELRTGALAMADKIKQYPLDGQHVMGSWERFTKRAIEEYKANRGDNAERDRTHAAYAVVFSSLRDARPAESIGDLKQRIDLFSAKHPPRTMNGDGTAVGRRGEVMKSDLRGSATQPGRERPLVDQHIDTALDTVRGLSPQLRSSIESSARELMLEGHHTQKSAKEALPAAVRDFQTDKSERNTVHMLTLAVIAKAPEQRALLREVWDLPRDQMKEIEAEGRARLERYPPLETGLADLRKDSVDAAVRLALSPNAATQREAHVLAHAREELECLADPKRLQWQNVSDELARDLA